jgi:hypothetical protein
VATFAVPTCCLPAVTAAMLSAPSLTYERYDLGFRGQHLHTTYFDTCKFDLFKARRKGSRYLTLRLRRYSGGNYQGPASSHSTAAPTPGGCVYALSAKTESEKVRIEIPGKDAEAALSPGGDLMGLIRTALPADLLGRLLELVGDHEVEPVIMVCCRRYALEDEENRLTLDVDVRTDLNKGLPYAVLEFKSIDKDAPVPSAIADLGLRPALMSKFQWSVSYHG